jgi:DNA-directed RNA polymerase subunit L
MKLRIKNMVVLGIQADNPIYTPPKKNTQEDKNTIDDDIDMDAKDDNVNSSSLKQLTMYLDYENNSNNIVTVGTDDCKFYYSEKQIPSPYTINIPIIKLQPKQKFKMSAITVLGIEHLSSIYSPVSIFTYKQLDENNFRVMLESRGQLTEKQILQYAYDNIKMMLQVFLSLVPNRTDISGKLMMMNGEHTIGNIISEGLQSHKLVKFGGYNAPHLLDQKIIFEYELVKEHDIKDIMSDIVEKYIDIFTNINNLIHQ